jgi:hypothetical protein
MDAHDLALYRKLIQDRDTEIRDLREVVVRFLNRSRIATVEPSNLQQAIDRAFEARK